MVKSIIYGLGDFHIRKITEQIEDVVDVAKKFNPEDVLLLIEVNENIPELFELSRLHNVELMALYDGFKLNNLTTIGVDNRIPSTISHMANSIEQLQSLMKYTINSYMNYCAKIKTYNDNYYLNELYKRFANSINKNIFY